MFGIKRLKNIKISLGLSGLILIGVFALLVFTDLILKFVAWRFEWEFTVIPNLIEVVPITYNYGAAFSFLSNKEWAVIFFMVLTVVMLIVMILGFLVLPKRFVVLRTAIALIAAGALGNLVDRMAWGCVRDFVDVWMFGRMACCNFADFWIVFGVALAILDMLFLNEWAVLPLTKTAKEAQRERKAEEAKERASVNAQPQTPSEEEQTSKEEQDADKDGEE